jgi:hypothetical protein
MDITQVFSATNSMVSLENTDIKGVLELEKPIVIDLILKVTFLIYKNQSINSRNKLRLCC